MHPVHVDDFSNTWALVTASRLNHSPNHESSSETKLFDHCARHKRIGTLAGIVVFGAAEETVAIGMHFEQPHALKQIRIRKWLDKINFAVNGTIEIGIEIINWPFTVRAFLVTAVRGGAAV
jgi:hypothetical protein